MLFEQELIWQELLAELLQRVRNADLPRDSVGFDLNFFFTRLCDIFRRIFFIYFLSYIFCRIFFVVYFLSYIFCRIFFVVYFLSYIFRFRRTYFSISSIFFDFIYFFRFHLFHFGIFFNLIFSPGSLTGKWINWGWKLAWRINFCPWQIHFPLVPHQAFDTLPSKARPKFWHESTTSRLLSSRTTTSKKERIQHMDNILEALGRRWRFSSLFFDFIYFFRFHLFHFGIFFNLIFSPRFSRTFLISSSYFRFFYLCFSIQISLVVHMFFNFIFFDFVLWFSSYVSHVFRFNLFSSISPMCVDFADVCRFIYLLGFSWFHRIYFSLSQREPAIFFPTNFGNHTTDDFPPRQNSENQKTFFCVETVEMDDFHQNVAVWRPLDGLHRKLSQIFHSNRWKHFQIAENQASRDILLAQTVELSMDIHIIGCQNFGTFDTTIGLRKTSPNFGPKNALF